MDVKIKMLLEELYRSNEIGLKLIHKSTLRGAKSRNLNGPLLMSCGENSYLKTRKKILIIGQECALDDEVTTDISYLMDSYHQLRSKRIFGQGAKSFYKLFNFDIEDDFGFLWTNVCKFSACGGGLLENDSDFEFTIKYFNVLREEIKIISPEVVLFLSGPSYDGKIIKQFESGDLQFVESFEGVDKSEIAQIVSRSNALPVNTFRTYHPRHLRAAKKWNYFLQIAAKIQGFDFMSMLSKLKFDLGSDYEVSDAFGVKNSFIKYCPKSWNLYEIKYEIFDNELSGINFGITAKKELTNGKKMAEKVVSRLPEFAVGDDVNWWACIKSFNIDFGGVEIFERIESGNFAEEIKRSTEYIIENTKGLKL